MKKIIYSIFTIFILFMYNLSFSQYIITNTDKIILNKINTKIYKIIDKDPLKYKILLVKQLIKINSRTIEGSRVNILIQNIIKNTKNYSLEKTEIKHYKEYNLDITKLRNTWLRWQNEARSNLGLQLYSYDTKLNDTAFEWSFRSKNKGIMDHKRDPDDSFYNYKNRVMIRFDNNRLLAINE